MRELLLRSLVIAAAAISAIFVFQGEAAAEVCDKTVGESWRTEDGPVSLLNRVGFPFALTILIAGVVLVTAARMPWLGYGVAIFLLFLGSVAVFNDLIAEHDIYLAQLREGCRSRLTDLLDFAVLAFFALTYAFLGYRAHQPTIARQLRQSGLNNSG